MDKNRIGESDQTVRPELERGGPNSPIAPGSDELLRIVGKQTRALRSLRRQRLVLLIALIVGAATTWTVAERHAEAVDQRELVINRCMLHLAPDARAALRTRLLEPFPAAQDNFYEARPNAK
jgi:hypothetical protein